MRFGGHWTEQKLLAVEKYLKAYMRLMTGNERASHFRKIYLDGFAGSGGRESAGKEASLFEDEDARSFTEGSAIKALSVKPAFDRYVFVDASPRNVQKLESLKEAHSELSTRVEIVRGDVNEYVLKWSHDLGPLDRALVFLDPFGMQVSWETLKALADTQKADVWVLVPLGQAIMRLLTKGEQPKQWADALTRFFGTDEWKGEFYPVSREQTLFGEEESTFRNVDFPRVTEYVVRRLGTIFTGVLDKPGILRNSTGCPIYLLCFGVGNVRGKEPALNIARSVVRDISDGG